MRCNVFKLTTDNWFPSYKLNCWFNGKQPGETGLVEVTFTKLGPSIEDNSPGWRTCVWGGDDCGMEKDFINEKEAWCCFLEVIGLEDVTMEKLHTMGFVSA